MSILRLENVNVSFNIGKGSLDVIDDLNLVIDQGTSIAMIGESGSGKSVIASSILRILEKNARITGKVLYHDDEDIYKMSRKRLDEVRGKGICLIPQNASQAWDPIMRIGKQMTEFIEKTGYAKNVSAVMAAESLIKCGFDDPSVIMKSYPYTLSGGMSQRAMIAMCLAVEPEMIIADEPTKGLDTKSVAQVIDLMTMITREKRTLMMITHDLDVAQCCEETAVLYSGLIVERGKSSEVASKPLHPYTKGLILAQPKNGMHPIPGDIGLRPDWIGCPFKKRCEMCEERCMSDVPLREVGNRLVRCFNA